MMNGGEAADQMVSYAFKGGEVVLRLSGSAAKNLAVYLANALKEGGPSKGKTTLKRMIADGSPLTVQRIKVDEIPYFNDMAKKYLSQVTRMTDFDEMDIPSIGERKTVVYCCIPDNDTSFNYLIGMFYTQTFQQLYNLADRKYGGRLPVHVHFLMDEFANVALPDDFEKLLATMRSREISVSIIIQNMAQLKALFKDSWESIVGNCDTFVYLGGNEQSTHEYVSKLMGKGTIDTTTHGLNKGKNGSYSDNYQQTGRELLTSDEVRMLDNRYALLFIRGERPIVDEKYDLTKHPNIKYTPDGGGKPYNHDGLDGAPPEVSFDASRAEDYALLDGDELTGLLTGEIDYFESPDEHDEHIYTNNL